MDGLFSIARNVNFPHVQVNVACPKRTFWLNVMITVYMRRETTFDVYDVMNDVILLLYLDIVEYYVIECL